MVLYTGDIHGHPSNIIKICKRFNLTRDDIIVILGDVGANYYGGKRDSELKMELAKLKPTILCIHGNHEMRPWHIPSYALQEWHGGQVWVEEKYPNLLFAKDGEIYDIDGVKHIAIGGAYSVDKPYRLTRGFAWFPDEQPSDEIKAYVESQLENNHIDVILSHTCPYKYRPIDAFLPMIDQRDVDESTELWLDTIEDKYPYDAWFCGHWHIDRVVDKIHFLYNSATYACPEGGDKE